MIRGLLITVAVMLLSACGTRDNITVRVDASRPIADASLMTRCEPIPALKERASLGDLLEHDGMLVGMYAECALANDAKADYIEGLPKHNVD